MRSAMILEDHPSSRVWLEEILTEAFAGIAVESVDSIAQAKALLARASFDLVLLDISLPDGNGLSLIADIQNRSAHTFIVVTTIFDDDEHLFDALQKGAQGFLLKDQAKDKLVIQLKGILSGEPPLSPSVSRRMMRHFRSTNGTSTSATGALTPREEDVLKLLANGYTRGDISKALTISESTVASHTKQIYRKLQVSSRAEAAREAQRMGLVDAR